MKMEYERYSERYRRNETNGNVGIISEDSEVIRNSNAKNCVERN